MTYDVVVIGGGPGGYGAALYAASAGLEVALVEMNRLGGTCLHVGCIPAKELLETASVIRAIRGAGDRGVRSSEPTLDLGAAMARKQRVVDQLASGIESLLAGRKVTVFQGTASLGAGGVVAIVDADSHTTEVVGRNVILATGSRPRTLPGLVVDGTTVLTSDELMSIEQVPAKVAIIGGGAIGCEFASALADFGSEVVILEAASGILAGCDDEIARVVERSFGKRGISVRKDVVILGGETHPGGIVLDVGDEQLDVDMAVLGIGRRPFSDLLGLVDTSVLVDERGFVQVDDLCRTGEDGVYAIGDLIDTPQLAHVGFAEAIMVVKQILDEPAEPIDYSRVPWAIYCEPEVAFAGLTETAAREAGFDVVVSRRRFSGNGRAQVGGHTNGMVKIVAEARADGSGGRILGVHMTGPWVTEQIGQGYLAVNWEATVDELAGLIQPHPSYAELFGESVLALTGRSLH